MDPRFVQALLATSVRGLLQVGPRSRLLLCSECLLLGLDRPFPFSRSPFLLTLSLPPSILQFPFSPETRYFKHRRAPPHLQIDYAPASRV
jgi:hypothetical protein